MAVYEPAEDSDLLLKYVRRYARGKVLDLGTGSGIQALAAAKKSNVSQVIAADISREAVRKLKELLKKKVPAKIASKVKVFSSNFFSQVYGMFGTIIFNPPYLPQERGAEDKTISGGKKGWEISQRFLEDVSDHLKPSGQVLFLFSSLTNPEKINSLIESNLLEWRVLEKRHLFFEDLFVGSIKKSQVRQELERKGLKDIKYLARGKRGIILVGKLNGKKVVIKTKRKESLAQKRIPNEIKWLKIVNLKGIGPKLQWAGKNYLVEEFIRGEPLLSFLEGEKKKRGKAGGKARGKIRGVVISVLGQCRVMDQEGVSKEEMHRPVKDILVNSLGKPVLIDFERCHRAGNPHNVTQFGAFLRQRGLVKDWDEMKNALADYKKEKSEENLAKIIKKLRC